MMIYIVINIVGKGVDVLDS